MSKRDKVKSILYVEDEKSVQEELAEVLEVFCEKLYLADDGFQGLEMYKKHAPDIIISDIKMPVMDGITMAKEIEKFAVSPRIVFTTAFSDVEYFMDAIELQVDGYIMKPINLDLLEKKINAIIASIKLKESLEQKEQMLLQQSKLASMGEMIGNIAHQWKQPLSIISMQANNIKVDTELGELNNQRLLSYADGIVEQVKYLSATIDDFRGFFKPGYGSEVFDIKYFLEKCIDLVKAAFDDNTIRTIQEIDDKINSFGDPSQLSQAIINILNNAKDALKQAHGLREKLVFIVTAKEDDENNIVITIKDNAGGIQESIIERIFEPYFTTKEDQGGTGLGLYITHTIITKNLHGSVSVSNDIFEYEGVTYKGAKFTIVLPLA